MGTRADFYLGRGPNATWLGSIAWDGHSIIGHGSKLRRVKHAREFQRRVGEILAHPKADGTTPDQGWPWPWPTSKTTDYTYCFDRGRVYVYRFGHALVFPFDDRHWRGHKGPRNHHRGKGAFPDMSDRANVVWEGPRSGRLLVSFTPTGVQIR